MARSTPGWVLALAPIACTCTEPAADAPLSVPAPTEHEPRLPAWSGPAHPAARMSALPSELLPGALASIASGRPITATLQPGTAPPNPAAIDEATFELTAGPGRTDARLRWRIASGPPTERSTAAAPSWSALCSNAAACFRTGPWPDAIGWLTQLDPMPLPDTPVDMIATAWPHVATGALTQLRGSLPNAARGLFDTALSGLAEVEFSGGRLDKDGSFLTFLRLPTFWVNFASTALAYAGWPPVRSVLSDGAEVSWAGLPTGGIVLALDDGADPAMGWIVFASSAERFTWLATAPRTQAGPAELFARVEQLEFVLEHVGSPGRAWFKPYASAPLLVHIAADAGFLTARAMSGGKLR